MSATDASISEKMIKIESKDFFIDLKSNNNGVYLKISERSGGSRNSILIPASGVQRLSDVLRELASSPEFKTATKAKGVSPMRAERDMNPEVKSRSVYVSALSWNTTDDMLRNHMSQAGEVVNAVVLRRERSHRSLGCGVVEYRTRAMALHAVEAMNDTSLDGRMIHCREDRDTHEQEVMPEAKKAKERNTSTRKRSSDGEQEKKTIVNPTKVYVSNVSWSMTEDALRSFFSAVGEVKDVQILRMRSGRSKGSAVVQFAKESQASAAIENLNDELMEGRVIGVRAYFD